MDDVVINMNEKMKSETMKLEICFKNSQAINIVKNLPKDNRDRIIEKYLILSDMVISHASISTSKESVEFFFAPLRSDIEMIREQLKMIVPTMTNPASKGSVTVENIFQGVPS